MKEENVRSGGRSAATNAATDTCISAGRILFIDAYDSFSNNIVALLSSQLPVIVSVIRIDDPRFLEDDVAFLQLLSDFDAVVVGPGPGHPAVAADIGVMGKLWDLSDDDILPIFSICLGFQSLGLALGGREEKLTDPRHGLVTPITHCGTDIFKGIGQLRATQYHSLHVVVDGVSPTSQTESGFWVRHHGKGSDDLVPLAWDLSDENNGAILMALRHGSKPFWGVQFHPESVCTDEQGATLVRNWWTQASAWQASRSRRRRGSKQSNWLGSLDPPMEYPVPVRKEHPVRVVEYRTAAVERAVDASNAVAVLLNSTSGTEPMLLESGVRNGQLVNPETGRYSIIALPEVRSPHIRFFCATKQLLHTVGDRVITRRQTNIKGAFEYMEDLMAENKGVDGPSKVPFWGGLLGFFSYNAGLENINVAPHVSSPQHADIWLVFIERSVVIDHVTNRIYVQSLIRDDEAWLDTTLNDLTLVSGKPSLTAPMSPSTSTIISSPEHDVYCAKVRTCQHHLRDGQSYELCLTDTTLLHNTSSPWDLYLNLRQLNPAPFGAYLHFPTSQTDSHTYIPGISIASSSPERFLSWSRAGHCQFRPIKGTVKKSPGVTRASAEAILNSPKERAENLMIVDLIRHDLHGVLDPGHSVSVPKLMSVEEYETVYQLVSVIEGQVAKGRSGIDALAASLPPGSMTGAPKKRSCELLSQIEDVEGGRGLYSGVIGYMDVGGGGDFSVVIRTAFKWADEREWRVGAGGAVTVLSEEEGEWEEMLTKRERLLKAFCLMLKSVMMRYD